jgi:hypothetical protein
MALIGYAVLVPHRHKFTSTKVKKPAGPYF